MGWFYEEAQYFKENGEVDLIKEALGDKENPNAQLINGVVYTTSTRIDKDGNKVVGGLVVITDIDEEDGRLLIGTNYLPEYCGPAPAECPENILKLLTPTSDEYANEWRKRCWDNIKRGKEL